MAKKRKTLVQIYEEYWDLHYWHHKHSFDEDEAPKELEAEYRRARELCTRALKSESAELLEMALFLSMAYGEPYTSNPLQRKLEDVFAEKHPEAFFGAVMIFKTAKGGLTLMENDIGEDVFVRHADKIKDIRVLHDVVGVMAQRVGDFFYNYLEGNNHSTEVKLVKVLARQLARLQAYDEYKDEVRELADFLMGKMFIFTVDNGRGTFAEIAPMAPSIRKMFEPFMTAGRTERIHTNTSQLKH